MSIWYEYELADSKLGTARPKKKKQTVLVGKNQHFLSQAMVLRQLLLGGLLSFSYLSNSLRVLWQHTFHQVRNNLYMSSFGLAAFWLACGVMLFLNIVNIFDFIAAMAIIH